MDSTTGQSGPGPDEMRRAEGPQVNPTLMALRRAESQVTEISALVVKQADELRSMSGMLKRTAARSRRRGIALKELNRSIIVLKRELEWVGKAHRLASAERTKWRDAARTLSTSDPVEAGVRIRRMLSRLNFFENGP